MYLKYTLIHKFKISESRLTRLRNNEIVKAEILNLNRLCIIMACNIEDVCEFKRETENPRTIKKPLSSILE